ncbi:hypothetical protein D3C86_926290 [compost metagenome]
MQRPSGADGGNDQTECGKQQPTVGHSLVNLVCDPATKGQAEQPGDTDNHTGGHRCFLQRHQEITLQHRHQERVAGIGGEVEAQPGHDQPEEGRHRQHPANRPVNLLLRNLHAFSGAALGLFDEKHEDRKDQPRYGGDEEGCAPAVESLDHGANGKERQQQAQGQAEHENAHGPRPTVGREQVADQRVCGGRVTGLADADAHAHDQETPETADHAVDRGQSAPRRQPPTHQFGARARVSHPPQGQAGNGIDDGEGSADDPQLKVAEVPFHADRFDDDGRDGAVEKVEQVGQEQQEQNAPGIRRLGRVLHGSVSLLL